MTTSQNLETNWRDGPSCLSEKIRGGTAYETCITILKHAPSQTFDTMRTKIIQLSSIPPSLLAQDLYSWESLVSNF